MSGWISVTRNCRWQMTEKDTIVDKSCKKAECGHPGASMVCKLQDHMHIREEGGADQWKTYTNRGSWHAEKLGTTGSVRKEWLRYRVATSFKMYDTACRKAVRVIP